MLTGNGFLVSFTMFGFLSNYQELYQMADTYCASQRRRVCQW